MFVESMFIFIEFYSPTKTDHTFFLYHYIFLFIDISYPASSSPQPHNIIVYFYPLIFNIQQVKAGEKQNKKTTAKLSFRNT